MRLTRHFLARILLLLAIFTLIVPVFQAQSEIRAVTTVHLLNIRSGPDTSFPVVEQVILDTTMILNGRNGDATWVQGYVVLDPTISGWVASELIQPDPGTNINTLPVLAAVEAPAPVPPPAENSVPIVPAAPESPAIPPLPPADPSIPVPSPIQTFEFSPRVYEIFALGQSLGNNANIFIKIGDSVTTDEFFLQSFGEGDYDLGGYTYLQPTIDYFNTSNAFLRPGLTAGSGFATLTLLDPIWAPPQFCENGETIIQCELRRSRPAIALIYLAGNDINYYSAAEYDGYMRQIVAELMANGVIPVMSTFGIDPDYRADVSADFQQVIRNIARDNQLPIIYLDEHLQPLPNGGVFVDEYHLTLRRDGVISFVTDQTEYGATLRELVNLQLLHELRLEVIGQ